VSRIVVAFPSTVVFSLALATASGCCFGGLGDPSPDDVCAHLEAVWTVTYQTDISLLIPARTQCVTGMTRMQTENPSDYSTSAGCIMAIPSDAGSLLSGCENRVLPYLPGGLLPPQPAAPAVLPVTNPRMDPRTVEPCVTECGGASNTACWDLCLARRADEINASIH
jgi:hypothetical protein